MANSRRCSICNSSKVIKKGKQNSRQRYQCKDCGHWWARAKRSANHSEDIWRDYSLNNLTINTLGKRYNISESSLRTILYAHPVHAPQEWLSIRSEITTIILDAAYITRKRSHGLLVAINAANGEALYVKEILGAERICDYEFAIKVLLLSGYDYNHHIAQTITTS